MWRWFWVMAVFVFAIYGCAYWIGFLVKAVRYGF